MCILEDETFRSLAIFLSLSLSLFPFIQIYVCRVCSEACWGKRKKLKTIKERRSLVWHTIMITLNSRRQRLTAIFIFFRRTHISALSFYVTSLVIVNFFRFSSAQLFFLFSTLSVVGNDYRNEVINLLTWIYINCIAEKAYFGRDKSSREGKGARRKQKNFFEKSFHIFMLLLLMLPFHSLWALLLRKKIVYVVCAGRKQHCKNGRNIPNTRQ